MTLAIVTVTKGGLERAREVENLLPHPVDIYTQENFQGGLKNLVQKLFQEYSYILFIMATGIVVRVIAPYIQDKTKDPGIMVMDEKGTFVISLLSGHLGGANAFTHKVAKAINAQAVITTASDVLGLRSVDMLAQERGCTMESLEKSKEITADMVNGKKIGLWKEGRGEKPKHENYDGMIYISNRRIQDRHPRSVQLFPKNLVLGIGCKRGTPATDILKFIKNTFITFDLKVESIVKLSSVDIKQDEGGLLQVSETLKVPIEFIPRKEIKKIEEQFKQSDFVKKAIGVGAVAQPCGYISSKGGRCLVEREKYNGCTLSVWEAKQDEQ